MNKSKKKILKKKKSKFGSFLLLYDQTLKLSCKRVAIVVSVVISADNAVKYTLYIASNYFENVQIYMAINHLCQLFILCRASNIILFKLLKKHNQNNIYIKRLKPFRQSCSLLSRFIFTNKLHS